MTGNRQNITRLHKKLNALMDKAVWEYAMIDSGDRLLMAVSGGADSMAVLKLLSLRLGIYADDVRLYAVYVDAGFGRSYEKRRAVMQDYFDQLGIEGRILKTDIGPYSHSDANLENPCFLCSRLRRKMIFETAEELNCNKIVFGHHKDDIIETLLINMIWGREISTMTPKLAVFQGKYHILRPLVFAEEILLKKFAREQSIPHFSQGCPTDGHSKRQYIKNLLDQLEADVKGARENIFHSMRRVKTDYLL